MRVAALGSPVRRTVARPYSSRAAGPLRRRLVVGLLVVVSLAMITVYFRESPSGRLHDFQSAGASVLRPFEIGAQRVARPFRDAYGWVAGVFHAKSENEELEGKVDELRQQVIQYASALQEKQEIGDLLRYRRALKYPDDFTRAKPVAASVISNPASEFEQRIVISAGSRDGIRVHDPVITARGLVGRVTKTSRDQALVTLLTDQESAVTARDLQTGAIGVLEHGPGGALILDHVPKEKVVRKGDLVVTAGRQQGQLPSVYPRGIQIGIVTSARQTDVDLYKSVQVMPFVDFSSLDTVLVLVSDKPRPRLP